MNTPTHLTDSEIDDLVNRLSHTAEDHLHRCCRATVLDTIEFIKELRSERDQLRKELAESQSCVRALMESTAIAASTIARLETERDQIRKELSNKTGYAHLVAEIGQLRKMLDAFAECGDCGDEWLMADYRDLPHVRERKAK